MFGQKVKDNKIGKDVIKLNFGQNEFVYLSVLVKKEINNEQ